MLSSNPMFSSWNNRHGLRSRRRAQMVGHQRTAASWPRTPLRTAAQKTERRRIAIHDPPSVRGNPSSSSCRLFPLYFVRHYGGVQYWRSIFRTSSKTIGSSMLRSIQ
jgi:hypothetical protein